MPPLTIVNIDTKAGYESSGGLLLNVLDTKMYY